MTAPSDSKIGELLAKLEKLDYPTWLNYDIQRHQIMSMSATKDEISEWILQGVIQDAIKARGWRASIGTPWEYNDEIESAVKIYEGRSPYPIALKFAPTEAESLLAAYVAALEAEETR